MEIRRSTKHILIFTGAILLLGLAGLLLMGETDTGSSYEEKLRFGCEAGEAFTLSYAGEGNNSAILYLSDTDTPVDLNRVRSASGARYATDDESIVFWEHQGEATVWRDDEPIAEGCTVDSGLLVPQD